MMRDSYIDSLLRTKNSITEKPKRSKTFNIKRENQKIIKDTNSLTLNSEVENKTSSKIESGEKEISYVGNQLSQVARSINSYLLHSSDLKEYPMVFVVQVGGGDDNDAQLNYSIYYHLDNLNNHHHHVHLDNFNNYITLYFC